MKTGARVLAPFYPQGRVKSTGEPRLDAAARCGGWSEDAEGDGSVRDRGHGLATLDRRRGDPLVDGLDRGLVEQGHGLDDAGADDAARGVDQDLHDHRALDLLDEGFLRVLRLRELDRPRRLVVVEDGTGARAPHHAAEHASWN